MRALPAARLKTPAPDIGQRPAWQEKRWPAVTKSPTPARKKAAPAAGLAGRGVDLFREFIAGGFVIDPGIVRRANNGNHRWNVLRRCFWGCPARARNNGAAVAGGDSLGEGEGRRGRGGGRRLGHVAAACGELSCAAGRLHGGSTGGSRGGSYARGAAAAWLPRRARIRSVACLSEGKAASGVCHWKASSRPVTGDTGRQRSLT